MGSSIEVSEAGRGELTGVSRVVVVVFVIVKLSNDGISSVCALLRTPPKMCTSSSVTSIESVEFNSEGRRDGDRAYLARRSIHECYHL